MIKEYFNIPFEFVVEEDITYLVDYLTGCETYRYTIPIEHPLYMGFYLIPGFSNYIISRTGILLSLRIGNIINWQISEHVDTNVTGGYHVTNIYNDTNVRVGVSRHRLIMLVFTLYDFHPKFMWVNHIDGIPGNDILYNMEWVTPGENIKHAYDNGLYPNKLLCIDICNWITGITHVDITLKYAVEILGICIATLRSRLNKDNGKKYEDGWRVKLTTDPWSPLNEYVGKSLQDKPVIVRNIYTGELVSYVSTGECGSALGINTSTISKHCRLCLTLPFNGYNFRYLNDSYVWPDYSEMHLILFRKMQETNDYSNGILVTDINTGGVVFFGTQREASDEYGLSYITLVKLARNQTIRNNLMFSLFKIKE